MRLRAGEEGLQKIYIFLSIRNLNIKNPKAAPSPGSFLINEQMNNLISQALKHC
jgi:hypothetical protein